MILGKQPARHDPRTLRLENYATGVTPVPPVATWGIKGQPWPILGNDAYGDCVFAGIYHQIEAWLMNRRIADDIPLTGDVLTAYSAVTGFVPGVPATDNGTVMLDAMNYWRQTGLPWSAYPAHRIDGYASITPGNTVELRTAISEFGGALIGAEMPLAAEAQFRFGTPWKPVPGPQGKPGSWGGHCVYAVGYDAVNVALITWGRVQLATWAWITTYMDEGYAALAADWYGTGRTPGNVDTNQLRNDIARIT